MSPGNKAQQSSREKSEPPATESKTLQSPPTTTTTSTSEPKTTPRPYHRPPVAYFTRASTLGATSKGGLCNLYYCIKN